MMRGESVDPNAGHGLRLSRGVWEWIASSDEKEDEGYASSNGEDDRTLLRLKGVLTFRNDSPKRELFIAEVGGEMQCACALIVVVVVVIIIIIIIITRGFLLAYVHSQLNASCTILSSLSDVSSLRGLVKIYPNHPGGTFKPRGDGYWEAYILPAKQTTSIEVLIEVEWAMCVCVSFMYTIHNSICINVPRLDQVKSPDRKISLSSVDSLLLRVDYVCYGPHGRTPECQHVVLPIKFPQPLQSPEEASTGMSVSACLSICIVSILLSFSSFFLGRSPGLAWLGLAWLGLACSCPCPHSPPLPFGRPHPRDREVRSSSGQARSRRDRNC